MEQTHRQKSNLKTIVIIFNFVKYFCEKMHNFCCCQPHCRVSFD